MSNDLNEENILSIFIPNSYKIYWNTSSDDFRDKMLSEFKKFWNQDRSRKS